MITAKLATNNGELGSKVELGALASDKELQKAQFRMELSSIYEALAKKFMLTISSIYTTI